MPNGFHEEMITGDRRRKEIAQLQAENKRLWELLEMAGSQLRFIGCFAGCDKGIMRDNNGNISQCQCCDEQDQIEQALKEE